MHNCMCNGLKDICMHVVYDIRHVYASAHAYIYIHACILKYDFDDIVSYA